MRSVGTAGMHSEGVEEAAEWREVQKIMAEPRVGHCAVVERGAAIRRERGHVPHLVHNFSCCSTCTTDSRHTRFAISTAVILNVKFLVSSKVAIRARPSVPADKSSRGISLTHSQ
eukprot:766956-Hanusia_phi.AAC.4